MSTRTQFTMNGEQKCVKARIACAAYCAAVLYLSAWNTASYLWMLPIIVAIIYKALGNSLPLFKARELLEVVEHRNVSEGHFFLWLSVVLCGQVVYWLANFPGGFNLDALGQWDQIHGIASLTNWHPVFTTFLYWAITRIVDSVEIVVFLQLLVFSITVSTLLLELYHYGVSADWLTAIALFISINPAIGLNNICIIKDVWFSIVVLWIVWCGLKMQFSNGVWLEKWYHCILLGMLILTASLIRHNAIFFTIPLVVTVVTQYRSMWKQVLSILVGALICMGLISNPLFMALNIEHHSNLIGESMGIPMAIMANALTTNPDSVPEDVKEFLYCIADQKMWELHYRTGEWDSCKWDFGGIELLQDEDPFEIVDMTWRTVLAAPNSSYQSIRENTRVVWQVIGYSRWNTNVYIEKNNYGIYERNVPIFRWIVDKVMIPISNTLTGTMLTWNTGTYILLLHVLLLFNVAKKLYNRLIIIIPILTYDLLTMLLLCGPSHRYFYFNSILCLIAVAISSIRQPNITQAGE